MTEWVGGRRKWVNLEGFPRMMTSPSSKLWSLTYQPLLSSNTPSAHLSGALPPPSKLCPFKYQLQAGSPALTTRWSFPQASLQPHIFSWQLSISSWAPSHHHKAHVKQTSPAHPCLHCHTSLLYWNPDTNILPAVQTQSIRANFPCPCKFIEFSLPQF